MKTFDIYVYDSFTSEHIDTIPSISENVLKIRCNSLAAAGFDLKIVDCFDGVVVATMESMDR